MNLSVQAIGTRIAQALNREASTRAVRFPLKFAIREHPFGKDLIASVCTIVRDSGDGGEVPCLDLYKLNSLRSRYEHEVESEETVFGPIVRRIYAGQEVLA